MSIEISNYNCRFFSIYPFSFVHFVHVFCDPVITQTYIYNWFIFLQYNPIAIMNYPSWSLAILFDLMFISSDITIVTPAFFC